MERLPTGGWKGYWPSVKLWLRLAALLAALSTLVFVAWTAPSRGHAPQLYPQFRDGARGPHSGVHTDSSETPDRHLYSDSLVVPDSRADSDRQMYSDSHAVSDSRADSDSRGDEVPRVYLDYHAIPHTSADSGVRMDSNIGADMDTRYEQQRTDEPARYNLIVSTYMRSGSTAVGTLFGKAEDAFYTWEPLWLVSKTTYYRGKHLVCSHHSTECVRIDATNRKEFMVPPTTDTLSYLQSLLNCSFQNYPDFMIKTSRNGKWIYTKKEFPLYKKLDWKPFSACAKKGSENLTKCLEETAHVCQRKPNRVVKLLRMSLFTQEMLLENNPNVKIIHLVRDPRAIVNSHINTSFYQRFVTTETELTRDIRTLCDRMRYDIEGGQLLSRKYPDRFRVMHYEDMGDLNHFKQEMFKFIGLLTDDGLKRETNTADLAQHASSTVADSPKERGFHPSRYRTTLPWNTVNIVDTHCRDVLRYFGYNAYANETHLRDLERPAYRLKFSIDG